MTPYFSVIIPTLNEEQFLPRLLKELENQKTKNFEVIIVDSCSEDKTQEKALSFKNALPLHFIENERRNVSYQRNYGVKHAKGLYMIFLDADSQVNPFFTGKLEKIIKKKKGLFFLPKITTDDNDPDLKVIIDLLNIAFEASQVINRPFALGGAMIVEKNYFHTIGGFDAKLPFGEDTDIARRSLEWNVKIKFLSEVSVKYSLRRIRKEGKLQSMYKYVVSTVDYLMSGKPGKKLFEYEMGGHLYKNIKKSRKSVNQYLAELFKKTRSSFAKLLEE